VHAGGGVAVTVRVGAGWMEVEDAGRRLCVRAWPVGGSAL